MGSQDEGRHARQDAEAQRHAPAHSDYQYSQRRVHYPERYLHGKGFNALLAQSLQAGGKGRDNGLQPFVVGYSLLPHPPQLRLHTLQTS